MASRPDPTMWGRGHVAVPLPKGSYRRFSYRRLHAASYIAPHGSYVYVTCHQMITQAWPNGPQGLSVGLDRPIAGAQR
jgi:hypothetical protein